MSVQNQCLECGNDLFGRADKKFCSDYCRNAYNNRQNSDATKYIRNINNVLRKNRRLLSDLLPGDKVKVSRDLMLRVGFNFNYFTNIYKTKNGTQYYFCYEFGYLFLDSDEILIVKREPDLR